MLNTDLDETREGYHWKAYDIWSEDIAADSDFRLDYKYWEPKFRNKLNYLLESKCLSIKDLNIIGTSRGISPCSECYVDEKDGYALVVKAGSNISRFGEIVITSDSDWIE